MRIWRAGPDGHWYGTSGVADLPGRRAMTAHDRLRVGSITKVFVATAVLHLVAEGRIDLATPVHRVLPGLSRPASCAPWA
ncbi:serine hydrolase domain-containing protein [Streptomyces longwoodensis]|uniref:serine hydrolase domain-containing protein n=1 Tax=Streptomyces longwoodensis TaxID=68231 RepID=UPI0033E16C67